MTIFNNEKDRVWVVEQKSPNYVKITYTVSLNKAKKASKLTIKIKNKKIKLDGRQINNLKYVLNEGDYLKNC